MSCYNRVNGTVEELPSAFECEAVEPFKIICVTCQAKLSVRNESLIGQIVACPRCESMVEVTPPADASLAVAPQPTEMPEELSAVATTAENTSLPITDAELLQVNAAVAKYKLIAWSLASFFVGAALVGGVLLTRSHSNNEATALVPNEPETVIAELPAAPVTIVKELPLVETPPEIVPDTEPPAPTITESVAVQPVTEPVEQPALVTPADELPADEFPEISPAPATRVARRFDPLDFDPESLTLATVDQPAATEEPSTPESTVEPIEVTEKIPSTVPLVRRGPDMGKYTGEHDAEKQLDVLIPAVRFDQLPLVDCLRHISQLSGMPVSVNPEQLLMAGIAPEHQVSFKAKDAGLNFILDQLLEPLHLEYVTRAEQIVVVRREATKRREINYPVDDFVDAGTSAKQLAAWIEQMVAPTTWKSAGGEGTLETLTESLRIGQMQRVQYQVLILLERLRLARNFPPQSRFPVERLLGTPAKALLQEKLAGSTTFTFSHYTPLDDILVHWQTELGVPLLIDWPALSEAECWPQTTIACAIIDQPWSVALEKVLEPLGLGWRATTGGAIEITSVEKVHGELQLELYPLRRDFDGDAAQLRSLAKQHAGGVLLYDPVGKVLLALESASTQRVIFQQLSERELLRE